MTTENKTLDLAAFRARLEATDGPKLWRSLEELSEDENFRQYLNEEFPRESLAMEEGSDAVRSSS